MAWKNGTDFTQWFLRVARAYREPYRECALAFRRSLPVVMRRSRRMNGVLPRQCSQAIAASDWVGVHAYFVGDGNDLDVKPDLWRQMAQGRSIIITEGGPADNVQNNGTKLHNVYIKCAGLGIPRHGMAASPAQAHGSRRAGKNRTS